MSNSFPGHPTDGIAKSNAANYYLPALSSMPIIETRDETLSAGRYRIYVRNPDPTNGSSDQLLSNATKNFLDKIVHAYRHLLRDGDIAGRQGYKLKRQARLPFENPLLRLPICYTIVPDQQNGLVIDLTLDCARKAQIRPDEHSPYTDLKDQEWVRYLMAFGQLCAYDVRAHCEDAYRVTMRRQPSTQRHYSAS